MNGLKQGSLLQGGKYRIEQFLGQGGFGITYSAVQVTLNRRVAIKEFFMKDFCERDANTSHVTMGTAGGAQEAKRFKEKFMKEASLIAQFDNPHIVRIYDIFEENGTAYYVMEFLEDRWSQFGENGIPQEQSLNIIRQVGEGLSYIHSQNVLHLDVKPSNIMFRKDCAVLIDFGISKRYDSEGGQTSATPVGILRMVAYFLFQEVTRPNYLVWFIVAGLFGAISKNWWAPEVFIADSYLYDADSHEKCFIGNYKGHEVAFFHKYVDNCMSDTLIAYSAKYWDNEDSLEFTIIFPNSFSEIGGSIDYYNVPPPTSITTPSIPFYNSHEKRWTLCKLDDFYEWAEHPDEYRW